MYKHEFFKQNELSAGEVAFLYFKAFPDDLPGDEIAALTYLDKGTITKHREKYKKPALTTWMTTFLSINSELMREF